MKSRTLSCFADFHELVGGRSGDRQIYRGVADAEKFLLIPSVGRLTATERNKSGLRSFEKSIFRQFKQRAAPYLERTPLTDLDWLAVAQHHGLPTRLLDWTYNPLVALFFAVEQNRSCDAAVYVYGPPDRTLRSGDALDPFRIKGVQKFSPDLSSPRIIAQRGLFTIHHEPRVAFEHDDRILKVVIPTGLRGSLKDSLRRYNLTRSTLFPGLDGIADDLREQWS